MKPLLIVGLIVLILGIASFFVGIPRQESHGMRVGDAEIGVTTQHRERVHPVLSIVLVAGGIGLMAAGGRGGRRA